MDGPGIEEKALLQIAHLVARGYRSGKYRLAGLDVVEFNMHLLGITMEDGVEDATVRVARDFIQALTIE
jgi:hypothetical protein